MKKAIIILLSVALSASAFAQNLGQVTELFNNGATALQNNDKKAALDQFNQALEGANKLGDEGAEVAGKCKEIIPNIYQALAGDQFKESNIDGAIESLKTGLKLATEYGNTEFVEETTKLLCQFMIKKGGDLLSAGDAAGAKAIFTEAAAVDTTSANALLKLGQVSMKTGDFTAAEEAFKKAADKGQAAIAKKQLCNIYLKKAANALKAKDYNGALAEAKTAITYNENPTAYKIAGNCAAQLKDYKGAITYFSKYLELSPNAADKVVIAGNIEAFKKL